MRRRIARLALGIAVMLAAPPLCPAQTTMRGKHLDVLPQTGDLVTVLFFVRSDCPVSNLYAPEMDRISKETFGTNIRFWLVYPDGSDKASAVRKNLKQYYAQSGLSHTAIRDPKHFLVKQSGVEMMPEAAVFRGGEVVYHGRIDDRVAGLGKYRMVATRHDLEDAIRAAIAGTPAHPAGGPAYGCYIADAK